MAENKDYYKILGVDKTATDADIKTAYRALCKKWHPDLCHDDNKKSEYEENFKNINEAYQVLSNTDSRKKYDNGGFDASSFNFDFSNFGFDDFNPFNMFGNFGFNFHQKQARNPKGKDLKVYVNLTLKEMYNGCHKHIKYNRMDKCDSCHGSGIGEGGKEIICNHCHGTGKHIEINGNWQQITICPYCQGKGRVIDKPCEKCNGSGLHNVINEIDVDMPKGIFNGMTFSMNGYGDASNEENGINGNLYIEVNEIQDEKFTRDKDDLYCYYKISLIDALLGCKIYIYTIDDKKISTTINSLTKDGSKIRFKGKGMPIPGKNGQYGDLYIVIIVNMPSSLNDKEINLLNELKKQDNFKSIEDYGA